MGFIKSKWKASKFEEKLKDTTTKIPMGDAVIWGSAGHLKMKIVEIGDWDMDADTEKQVEHGITDYKKIRNVNAIIRSDDDNTYWPLDKVENLADPSLIAGGWSNISATTIYLVRRAGGVFDNLGYDATGFNRGWLTIWYEE